jgi:hypothetical protein
MNGTTDFIDAYIWNGDSISQTLHGTNARTRMSGCLVRVA